MKSVYIFTPIYDDADGGLQTLRTALQTAGLSPIIIAERSTAANKPKDIVILRDRAMAVLMFGSQIIMAAIILGYFTRFFPPVMTVLFWSLVLISIFIASRYGKGLRDQLASAIGAFLARIMIAQKRPGAIWLVNPEPVLSKAVAGHHPETVTVADFQTLRHANREPGAQDTREAFDPRLVQQAGLILADADTPPFPAREDAPESLQYHSDLQDVIDDVARRVK
ncbi:MAG: hypothetical protein GC188_03280 [Alphaproteobacteria bacterium]|nr:hypothetical protein [Alphaproteobacteria bacterium]